MHVALLSYKCIHMKQTLFGIFGQYLILLIISYFHNDRSYKYFRHPSYVGFYYWSVGTQLLLGNPICAVCYSLASWYFFKRRIPYEERTLLKYFPDEYPAYVTNTWSGLPFIWSDIVIAQEGGGTGTTPRASNSANHQEVSFTADGFADKKLT